MTLVRNSGARDKIAPQDHPVRSVVRGGPCLQVNTSCHRVKAFRVHLLHSHWALIDPGAMAHHGSRRIRKRVHCLPQIDLQTVVPCRIQSSLMHLTLRQHPLPRILTMPSYEPPSASMHLYLARSKPWRCIVKTSRRPMILLCNMSLLFS